MKKLLKILTVVFVVSVLALTFVACQEDPCKDGHTWDEGTVTKAATCTEKGEKTFRCTVCDKEDAVKTEEIAALGHDWDEANKTGDTATCMQAGTATVSCKRCSETKSVNTVALGHDWGQWGNNTATCTAAGTETRTCQRTGCDGTPSPATDSRPTQALGHEYVENKCVRFDACGEEMTEEQVLAAFNALEKPASPSYGDTVALLKGTFKLTGTITRVAGEYTADNGITVDIDVSGTTIQAYRMKAADDVDGIENLVVGDTITVAGELMYFNNGSKWIAEFDAGCLLKAVTKTQLNITWNYDNTLATVVLADDTTTLPTTVDGGSSVSFKINVTDAEHNKVSSVKAGNTSLIAEEGVYTVKVISNLTIAIKVVDKNAPDLITVNLVIADISEANQWVEGSGTKPDPACIHKSLPTGDEKIIVEATTKDGATGNTGANWSDGTWRLYANDAAKLKIAVADPAAYELVSIKVTLAKGTLTGLTTDTIYMVPGDNNGTIEFPCTSNANITALEIIYVAKHTHVGTYVTDREPNCTDAGSKHLVCNYCGKTVAEAIPATGHSFQTESGLDTSKLVAKVEAGADNLGKIAYYVCEACHKYFDENGALLEGVESADQVPTIHTSAHHVIGTPGNAGRHSIACDDCDYTKASEDCNTLGANGACSICGYVNASAKFVEYAVTYALDGAAATADAPANLEITWKDGEKNTLPTAPTKLECGKTYYISLNLNDKYTLVSVSIRGTEATATENNYEIAVGADETAKIEVVVTVNTVIVPVTVDMTIFANKSGQMINTVTEAEDANLSYLAEKSTGTTEPVVGTTLRLYKPSSGNTEGGKVTITVAAGYKITNIVLTAKDTKTSAMIYKVDNGTASATQTITKDQVNTITVADISAQSVAFIVTGTERVTITGISVTYEKVA